MSGSSTPDRQNARQNDGQNEHLTAENKSKRKTRTAPHEDHVLDPCQQCANQEWALACNQCVRFKIVTSMSDVVAQVHKSKCTQTHIDVHALTHIDEQ